MDKECQTLTWLNCDSELVGMNRIVKKLRCVVCTKYKERIWSRRNSSDRWLIGAESVRNSNIRDHAVSDQHFMLEFAEAGSYAPIAQSLSMIPQLEKEQLKRKFDTAYFLAIEKLSFAKFPQDCELEAHHGVFLGNAYTNDTACKTFTHYIAESQRQQVKETISQAEFFSLLIDGSTDKGNVDVLFMVVWCDTNGEDDTRMTYFHVSRPSTVTAAGLFEELTKTLVELVVPNVDAENCSRLVGIGSNGAASNIAQNGLRGLVEAQLGWIFWMWCLALRLELAVKDAFKATTFDAVDDMLRKLYYIYEKSPKKCRKLEEVISDLKGCITFDDSGIRPVSASEWLMHYF